jgi:hypothetical protein
LRRASGGGFFETDYNQFGKRVEFYDGIPIIVDDNISDALTVGTSVTARPCSLSSSVMPPALWGL